MKVLLFVGAAGDGAIAGYPGKDHDLFAPQRVPGIFHLNRFEVPIPSTAGGGAAVYHIGYVSEYPAADVIKAAIVRTGFKPSFMRKGK